MRARIIREDMQLGMSATAYPETDERVVWKTVTQNGRPVKRRFWRLGAEIEDPMVWRLVQCGVAIPADDACREACGLSEDQMAFAQKRYEAVCRGIAPEDYQLFFNKVISGYEDDGSFKKGDNWQAMPELWEEPESDEDNE